MATRIDELSIAIQAQLSQYSFEVAQELKEEVKEVAKQCVKEIKANAPVDSGDYKKGWRAKVTFESGSDIRIKVYNTKKPQLTHILEFGYAKVNGGRVEGKSHIYPAEQAAAKALERKAKVMVKR